MRWAVCVVVGSGMLVIPTHQETHLADPPCRCVHRFIGMLQLEGFHGTQ